MAKKKSGDFTPFPFARLGEKDEKKKSGEGRKKSSDKRRSK